VDLPEPGGPITICPNTTISATVTKISQNHTAEDRYQKEDKAVNFADKKVVEKCNTGEKNCQT